MLQRVHFVHSVATMTVSHRSGTKTVYEKQLENHEKDESKSELEVLEDGSS